MSAETERSHDAGMPPGFPELWESVTRARMDIAELKGMVKMHFADGAHHTPPCATARRGAPHAALRDRDGAPEDAPRGDGGGDYLAPLCGRNPRVRAREVRAWLTSSR